MATQPIPPSDPTDEEIRRTRLRILQADVIFTYQMQTKISIQKLDPMTIYQLDYLKKFL